MRNKYIWWVVTPLWGLAAWLVLSNEISLTWRFTVVFGFLLICPGRVYIQFLPISDNLSQLTIGIALSILLNSIVALLMIYTKVWEPQLGLIILIGLSILGIILQIGIESHKALAR